MNDFVLAGVYRRVATSFVIATVIFLIIVALTVLPSARVYVTPVEKSLSRGYTFELKEAPDADPEALTLQGTVHEIEITSEKTFPAKGHALVSDDISGIIRIRNEYSKDQALIATTRFLTEDGILLRLKETLLVEKGSSIEAEVYLDPTERSFASIETGRLTIPGLWEGIQDRIYGEITEPLTGPAREVTVVSEDDITSAREELLALAENAAIESLQKTIASSQEFQSDILSQLELADITVTNTTWNESHTVGDETDTFTVNGIVSIEGVFFIQSEAREKMFLKLTNTLAEGDVLFFDEGVVAVSSVGNVTSSQILIEWSGAIHHRGLERMVADMNIRGLTSRDATTILERLRNVESVRIELSPFWVKRIPKDIKVVIE